MNFSTDKPDYYEILHVSRNADLEVIKAAHKQLVKKHHPDHGGKHINMVLINEAYEVLSEPKMRRQYDLWLKEMESNKRQAATNTQKETNYNNNETNMNSNYNGNYYGYKEYTGSAYDEYQSGNNAQSSLKNMLSRWLKEKRIAVIGIIMIISSMLLSLLPFNDIIFLIIGWIGIFVLLYGTNGNLIITIISVAVLYWIFSFITGVLDGIFKFIFGF